MTKNRANPHGCLIPPSLILVLFILIVFAAFGDSLRAGLVVLVLIKG
jgi:hypothetical protein